MWHLLALGLLAAQAPGVPAGFSAAFAPSLPKAVGDVSGWEVVTGEFETTTERGAYVFYVNPLRGALYQLMRYRVELRRPDGPLERGRRTAERVMFVARPGVREPMLCWERVEGPEPAWREVAAGSASYLVEIGVLMRVIAAHRAVRLATPAP